MLEVVGKEQRTVKSPLKRGFGSTFQNANEKTLTMMTVLNNDIILYSNDNTAAKL